MTAQRVARVGDTVNINCDQHGAVSGTFTEGSPLTDVGGIRIVLVGHHGTASCGHHFVATGGSSLGSVLGVPIVRVGDPVQMTDIGGSGVVATGSPLFDLI